MNNKLEIKRSWLFLKRNCGHYFSSIFNYPMYPPEHVYFSLTNKCNLRCKICRISKVLTNEDDELTTEEWKEIIDQVVDMKINHIIFSGGEPLLREDIFDLIAYAVDKKIKLVDVTTNGILIDETVAKKLVDIGVNPVTISIDGLEETNDFIRGKGSFQKAMRAFDFINKYRNSNLPMLGINFTITDFNIDQILPVIDLARNKKCNFFLLQPMLSDNTNMQARRKNELWVSGKNISELKKVIRKVLKLKRSLRNLSIRVNNRVLEMIPAYFIGQPLSRNLRCFEGIVRIVICLNGDLWSCRGIYGNLRNNSLENCWFSSRAKKIRQEVKQCKNHCLQNCIYLTESY